jgi:hypothetical protein
MTTTPATSPLQRPRVQRDVVAAWKSPLLQTTLALLLFLAAGGLWIFLAPFSAYSQYAVLVHTLAGIVFLGPYAVYQFRHFQETWRRPLNHVLLLGYTGGVALLVAVVSGVVLTVESAIGTRISYAWQMTHIVSGLALIPLLGLHVAFAIVLRGREGSASESGTAGRELRRSARTALVRSCVATAALLLVPLAAAALYGGLDPSGAFPADYGYKYGSRPFAPSLAVTASGGAIEPLALAGSASCGTSGCHEQIVREWEPSAHRYASRSYFFQEIQRAMAQNNGPESTRYCGGCHDPIALFSGAKNIYDEDLSSHGADEGVSCASCHSITKSDVKGNANYVIEPPRRYLFEEKKGAVARLLSSFLIRAYPAHHVTSYSRDLYKTPEYCGACHKQFIDEEINRVGWVQLQNQYDNWRKSHWFKPLADDPNKADPAATLSCRECHMRLVPGSDDPASGDSQDFNRAVADGSHRSHRFIGANQWHPVLHGLPGAAEHVRLTEEWLRGETVVPEIQDRWAKGPAVPIELIVPPKVAPGDQVTVRTIVSSNKVGHDFPTGPLDIIQCWVELRVHDETGKEVFASGRVDEKGFIDEGSFMFKAEGIDKTGNLIDRHNLWEMVGARFRRSLFPGFSDSAEFSFTCPSAAARMAPLPPEREATFRAPEGAAQTLRVEARLRYRKVDQTLINFVAPGKGLTAPITDLSTAKGTIRIEPRRE